MLLHLNCPTFFDTHNRSNNIMGTWSGLWSGGGDTHVPNPFRHARFRSLSVNSSDSSMHCLRSLTITGRKGRGPFFLITGMDDAPFPPRETADAGAFPFAFTLPTRGSSFAAMEVVLGEGTGGSAPRPDVISEVGGMGGTEDVVLILFCSGNFAVPPLVATNWPRMRPDCEILTLKVGDTPVGSLLRCIAIGGGDDGALACLSPRLPPPMPAMFV